MSDLNTSIADLLAQYEPDVDHLLREEIGHRTDLIHRIARYHLGWTDENGHPGKYDRGKGIRSTMCLLTCDALSGDHRPALPAAASIDLIHNFTLIHDDIMDGDALRRGRPSVWKLWGIEQAINTGDMLYALAFVVLTKLSDSAMVPNASRLLSETCVTVVQGQASDIDFEKRHDVSADEYLIMISQKTAALIGTALELGALAAGVIDDTRNKISVLGIAMGIAYQIRDDMLGTWGDSKITGKPVGEDLRRKKKSLPVLMLQALADAEGQSQIDTFFRTDNPTGDQIQGILELMRKFRIYDSVRSLAESYTDRAREALDKLPNRISRHPGFLALIEYFTARNL